MSSMLFKYIKWMDEDGPNLIVNCECKAILCYKCLKLPDDCKCKNN